MLRALLWDVDGTLAETERDGHRVAFNQAFEALGVPWRWDAVHYGRLLAVTGGIERLLFDMAGQPEAPVRAPDREALAREVHRLKTRLYSDIVHGGAITLRPGVRDLLAEGAAAGMRMAITTTTSRPNVDALLAASGLGGFEAVLCADSAPLKKPHPQIFQRALAQLVLPAGEVVAIEDSPAGVAACAAAGVPVVLARSAYFADATPAPVLAAGPGLNTTEGWWPAPQPGPRVNLPSIAAWHAAGSGQLSGQ